MMSENKKKGLSRWLLMAVSMVLVVAISVGVTLAYLTAQTDIKTNNFIADSDNLTGNIYEPAFDVATKTNLKPDDVINKDPMIQNETKAAKMYAGLKVNFVIKGNFVSYDTFRKYVGFYAGDTKPTPVTDGYTCTVNSGWTDVTDTALASATGYNSLAKYYVYGTELTAYGTKNPTANHGDNEGDTTAPLFNHVVINPYVNIDPENKTIAANAATSAYAIETRNSSNQFDVAFEKLDFKIILTGYGVDSSVYTDSTTPTYTTQIITGLTSAQPTIS